MTIIKQRSVISGTSHQKNLRNYINNDEKVLLRESQNMEACDNIKQWTSFMSQTRDMFGHNKASRKGKDGEEAKNTILYHQILGFNPDECDVNGGKLSPNDCMRYAKEYIQTYYPNQQIVLALHNEYCKEDQTHRYAVHMVINRSDLATGKRLHEGLGVKAKKARASRIRKMDAKWDLKQVQEGKINSIVHHKQTSQVEKNLEEKGIASYKTNLRELLRIAAKKAEDLVDYRTLLESWGVDTEFRHGRMYATDRDNANYSFSVIKLDAELAPYALRQDNGLPPSTLEAMRNDYKNTIKEQYLAYRKQLQALKTDGKNIDKIPQFSLPKPPTEIANDQQIKKYILAYWRGADELRTSLTGTPHKIKLSGRPERKHSYQQQQRQKQKQQKMLNNKDKKK
ncbi:relaxase/mobilization nuclease domain-containing protein [Arcanobacterium hippocoleae]|uniref:MobA/VirD2-like nuclease domain-containing protein n=1 Tax=Arcanobacterium hippocoleae TaxID=149017 RepID=A0ABU1T1T4_9ACTO|nr:relaxase/mobilization nuclease domain-containing protein [Arcanobacterium hippocoleae]MDR6939230.1 hypothetical protein [Arcanobacterium hippocoleae]